jgi:hypothetical protein
MAAWPWYLPAALNVAMTVPGSTLALPFTAAPFFQLAVEGSVGQTFFTYETHCPQRSVPFVLASAGTSLEGARRDVGEQVHFPTGAAELFA